MLAKQVHEGNQKAAGSIKVNLQGYLVGNGVTDPVFDGNALVRKRQPDTACMPCARR